MKMKILKSKVQSAEDAAVGGSFLLARSTRNARRENRESGGQGVSESGKTEDLG